jgi:hypothetical protein
LPRTGAFAARGIDPDTGLKETGISSYLLTLTTPADVLAGLPELGLIIIDIGELYRAVANVRRQGKAKPFGEFTVWYDPIDDPSMGPARHAHVYIDPVTRAVEKELVRLTSPSRVVRPCVALRPNTGSTTVT